MEDFDDVLADNVYNLITGMDGDDAEMFARVLGDEMYEGLVAKNQRLIIKKNMEIAKGVVEVAEKICKSLVDQGREEEAEAVMFGARSGLVEVLKADDGYWNIRGADGKFAATGSRRYQAPKLKKVQRQKRADTIQRVRAVERVGRDTHAVLQRPMKDTARLTSNLAGNVRGVAADESAMLSRMMGGKEGIDRANSATNSAFRTLKDNEQKQYAGEVSSMDRTWNTMQDAGMLASGLGAAGATLGIPGAQGIAMAGQAANVAGQMAPHGERIVGPSVRRAKYRYQGVERKIDPALAKGVKSQQMKVLQERLSKMPVNQRNSILTEISQKGMPVARFVSNEDKEVAALRGTVDYLREKLPAAHRNGLREASGKIAPSQGIIIDDKGTIRHQSVGIAEDHYMPFKHGNLKAMKSGSYVRSRTMGGPTTEDIRTGLMTGAKTMVVVSHSGVFQVDFDDDFDGKARSSNRAKQMVDRYGKLLDAVQSKQVGKNPLSPMERATIFEETKEKLQAERGAYGYVSDEEVQTRFKAALEAEQLKPPRPTVDELKAIEAKARQGYSQAELETDRGKREVKIATNALTSQMMEKKGNRFYSLNGKGYQDALETLQDEFPYFIKVQPLIQEDDAFGNLGMSSDDSGYVKPRFLHPERERHGYFGEGINAPRTEDKKGSKRAGDTTEYQNHRYNRQAPARTAESTGGAAGTPGSPSAPQAAQAARNKAAAHVPEKSFEAVDIQIQSVARLVDQSEDFTMDSFPTMNKWKESGLTEKKQLLDDPKFVKALVEETGKFQANIKGDSGVEFVTRLDKALSPRWSDSNLHGEPSPLMPYKMDNDQRGAIFSKPGVIERYAKTVDEFSNNKDGANAALRDRSNTLREQKGNPNVIAALELARRDIIIGDDPSSASTGHTPLGPTASPSNIPVKALGVPNDARSLFGNDGRMKTSGSGGMYRDRM